MWPTYGLQHLRLTFVTKGCLQKKNPEKETLVHTGGRGVKKIPFFWFIKKGTYSYGGGFKIFLSHVPCSLLCFCFHTICSLSWSPFPFRLGKEVEKWEWTNVSFWAFFFFLKASLTCNKNIPNFKNIIFMSIPHSKGKPKCHIRQVYHYLVPKIVRIIFYPWTHPFQNWN